MHPAFQYQKSTPVSESEKNQQHQTIAPQQLSTGSHSSNNYSTSDYKAYVQTTATIIPPLTQAVLGHHVVHLNSNQTSSIMDNSKSENMVCKNVLPTHDKIIDMSTTKDSGNESEIDHINESDDENGSNDESEEIDLTSGGGCIDYSNNNKVQ